MIETNVWKELRRVEGYLNFPLVGYGIITIPKNSIYLSEQIFIFGGWKGNEYTNKMILSNKSSCLKSINRFYKDKDKQALSEDITRKKKRSYFDIFTC